MNTLRRYYTLFISYIHTNMNKKHLIIIGLCIAFTTTTGFIGYSFASVDPNALDKARIEQLKREITDNQAQYAQIQPQMARNQERCSVAQDEQRQLTTLNSSNTAKRSELMFLQAKVNPTGPAL